MVRFVCSTQLWWRDTSMVIRTLLNVTAQQMSEAARMMYPFYHPR